MAPTSSKLQRSELSQEVEPRIGRIPFKGRYHKLPRKFEEDYKVTSSVLGKGYNGVVRLADDIHSSSKQHFAVKTFKTKGLTEHKRHQLDAEIEIFLCMDHPHIARLVDVYESSNTITIVMECAEGGELFDRVTQQRFSEDEAADAVRQILLALNYIHSHGIVHRDLKLENILYDTKGGHHLKLIDFGFSKFHDSGSRLHTSCGTLAYIAPEVLNRSYTSQCDLWSLGVITFILLSNHMPFHGGDSIQDNIRGGQYVMKPAHWRSVSKMAQDFTHALLTVDPNLRLDAKSALEHSWIASSRIAPKPKLDSSIIDALLLWRTAPKFHRACMLMMAWLLTNEQQAQVRDYFLALDKNHDGAISYSELRDVMVSKFQISEEEVHQVFDLLDTTHHKEIHYSEFLAAMMANRIELNDDLLQKTFHHFDTGNTGDISAEDFQMVLGESFEGEQMDTLYAEFLAEAGIVAPDGKLCYDDFARYAHACAPKPPADGLGMSPSRRRRTFAPKLWAAIQARSPLQRRTRTRQQTLTLPTGNEPSLPTLLREGSPANRPKSTQQFVNKKMGPVIKRFSTLHAQAAEPLPPPCEDDEVPDDRPEQLPVAGQDMLFVSGVQMPPLRPPSADTHSGTSPHGAASPTPARPPVVLPVTTAGQGEAKACCSIQ